MITGNTGTAGDDRNLTIIQGTGSLGIPGGEVHTGASNTIVDHDPMHIAALAFVYLVLPLGL